MRHRGLSSLGVLALLVLALASAPGWSMIQSGIAQYGNGQHVTFARAFNETPVVVTSGQRNGAVIVGAANNSRTGFDLKITDLNGNPVSSGVWVQWVAATYEDGIQLGLEKHKNGDHVTFPSALAGCTILTSGQKNGVPYLIGAVNNSSTGFSLTIVDANGNPGTDVWTQWIAVKPRPEWRCGVAQYSDGQRLSFAAMSGSPVIVASGQSGQAVAIAAVNNTASGCGLSVKNHQGQPAQRAWTQWWAVKSGMVSTAGAPVTPPAPPPTLPPTPPPPPQPPTPTGPVSTDSVIYLNSPRVIYTADYGDSGGSKTLSSGGWADYNKPKKYCRAYALGAGFVFTGGSSSYWSKVGKTFDVEQGNHSSSQRSATITVTGDYAGRIMAAILATSSSKLKVVVTDNGTQIASQDVFSKSGAAASWNNFNGTFTKTLNVTLKAGHSYNVFLSLDNSATAAIAGAAGADVGRENLRAGYSSIRISF